ncbi:MULTISPECIES: ATP-binding cassette domain-containing protein [unclassified Paenibacillus]|uniref:ATP-binding cassette domain-containing protein n=1 Tax=unclassified Paenibacillus TaxID=185978 RepID=UPI000838E267|nr:MULTISPECIES: ATP-binding cassette domain-containing protein [unclassified Paenibacillus]NWL86347.1 ABC transporter ATP-binding protein [Paenibacillus sp. 79R4]
MNMLEVANVYKSFRKNEVLKDINFRADTGILGILGNHGSGKTVLMNLISGLTKPTQGKVLIHGLDTLDNSIQVKERVGYLPQDFSLYDELNAYEMLGYIAKLNKMGTRQQIDDRIDEVLEWVNLKGAAYRKVGSYSPGMRRRLGIALVLIKDPDIILVDEPTTGLDPLEKIRFRALLGSLGERKLILLSTHQVDDIAAICDQLLFLKNKTVDFYGTPNQWLAGIQSRIAETVVRDRHQLSALAREYKVISMKQVEGGVHVRLVLRSNEPYFPYTLVNTELEDALVYYS